MITGEILNPASIACRETAGSKKRVLEKISRLLAAPEGLNEIDVFDKLLERERLGSTGLGQGVAIPHCRLQHAHSAHVALMTLQAPVNFEARDGKPADIVFGLIVPEHCTETHLQILAKAAEMFSDAAFCARLRASANNEQLYELVSCWQPQSLSA
ncbi:MAG TPA: PTS sugar transporter subunit IIA [Gammaproteobacteria bacterium]|nr:PTS sugar transporter subunit IIA [Gammaproteobacteria bacterium]